MTNVKVSVPGKIILSGEHAVVYGKPAIAAAVDKRLTATLKLRNDKYINIYSKAKDNFLVKRAIETALSIKLMTTNTNGHQYYLSQNNISGFNLTIESNIPIGAGMGSSAAIAVAVIAVFTAFRALRDTSVTAKNCRNLLDYKKINDLAYKVEKVQHGSPSGIDNSTVTFGGLVWYRKEFEFLKTFFKLQMKIPKQIDHFYLLNTGKPEESTKDMVGIVKEKYCKKHITIVSSFLQLLSRFEEIAKRMALALEEKNEMSLLQSIKKNGRLLEKLGVVGEFAKGIVREIESTGGAAKISGAGGVKDKSGLLFIYHKDKNAVKRIANKHKLGWFPIKLGAKGVRVEEFNI